MTRYPAVTCWIKHILEGTYSENDRILFTKFGKIKRVRIIATIIDKRQILSNQGINDDLLEDDGAGWSRLEFDLDDGTGLIRATTFNLKPENYTEIVKGDIVDIVGLIRYWNGFISITPEIIRKVDNPNMILLRTAQIIKELKSGNLEAIPEQEQIDSDNEDFSNELDIDEIFETDKDYELDELKEKIFTIIQNSTSDGNGISFNEIKSKVGISEEPLRNYLTDLEMESKIYQSEDQVYQTYQ
jgi:hypothetical protein